MVKKSGLVRRLSRWLHDAPAIAPVRSMFGKSRLAVAAAMVLGVAATLAGPGVGPASAALAQIYCFGRSSSFSALTPPEGRELSKRGSRRAVIVGTRWMVVHEFDNGTEFAIVADPGGEIRLLLAHPDRRMTKEKRFDISISIDGHTFKGASVTNQYGVLNVVVNREFLVAIYRGDQALIEIGRCRLTIATLSDAAAMIDEAVSELDAASR